MIGWAAVTGHVAWPAVMLFAIIFFWTPPHFWALALYRNEDYRLANVPMLPVMKGERRTKSNAALYAFPFLPLSLTPVAFGIAGTVYAVGALLLGIGFIICALRVLRDKTHKSAKQMFPLFARLSVRSLWTVAGRTGAQGFVMSKAGNKEARKRPPVAPQLGGICSFGPVHPASLWVTMVKIALGYGGYTQ